MDPTAPTRGLKTLPRADFGADALAVAVCVTAYSPYRASTKSFFSVPASREFGTPAPTPFGQPFESVAELETAPKIWCCRRARSDLRA